MRAVRLRKWTTACAMAVLMLLFAGTTQARAATPGKTTPKPTASGAAASTANFKPTAASVKPTVSASPAKGTAVVKTAAAPVATPKSTPASMPAPTRTKRPEETAVRFTPVPASGPSAAPPPSPAAVPDTTPLEPAITYPDEPLTDSRLNMLYRAAIACGIGGVGLLAVALLMPKPKKASVKRARRTSKPRKNAR